MKSEKVENCAECRLRSRYDKKPNSLIGRIWRWHINWCPGWKSYLRSLSAAERDEIAARYKLKS